MDFDGAAVLDLYAGSGALGLEALSRGAGHLLSVESDARASGVLARNIATVALPGALARTAPVAAVLAGTPDRRYDLVMADPPYSTSDDAVAGVLASLMDGQWLSDDALVVVERSSRSPLTRWPDGLRPEKDKKYGEARIEIASVEFAP
ncbi:hypothetical protein GCM10007304_20830 [Rhodococcoides trifolii]|uniref:Methyltransferase n=2 Tax=Rhodococcoides trifolii TaxID=908250 RepID=A0A917D1R7_9NOCA|nr:hypothetical protein GCM10007304_20830 [Rhodococcus trifolii]